jgi:dephospho-CoA kinase
MNDSPENKTPKPVIGIIGGVGSGKSTVARLFGSLGCAVIDADTLAHEAISRPDVQRQIIAWWGPGVLKPDGTLDRRAVGRIVFNDEAQLLRLESLVHPMVRRRRAELREQYQGDPGVIAIVEDTPLLLEKGLAGDVDALVFVAADEPERGRRVADRGWVAGELGRREKMQLPLDTKRNRADYIIDNNAGEAETLLHVRRVLSQILHQDRGE